MLLSRSGGKVLRKITEKKEEETQKLWEKKRKEKSEGQSQIKKKLKVYRK